MGYPQATPEMTSELRAEGICIVGGAGHIGLPLALLFAARGYRVVVHDIDEEALGTIRSGRMPFAEEGAEALLRRGLGERRLCISSDLSSVGGVGTVIVAIGSPASEPLQPESAALGKLLDDMLPYLSNDQLLVLRSTVAPGTTDWMCSHLRENGRTPKVAFCPERIVQGESIREIGSLGQIVAGTTPEAEREAAALFGRISKSIVYLTPIEAELSKLFCNAFRYVTFAIANQFYMIANDAGVDYHRVHEAMRHDYPRAAGIPTAGFVGGPCLPKDTAQLGAFAGDSFSLGRAAMDVNQGLVNYLVEEIRRRHGDLRRLRVGLLGMAFKADCDDTRVSLSYRLKDALEHHVKEVRTTDPHVTTDPDLAPVEEVVGASDLLVLGVPHAAYRDLQVGGTPVLDVWGWLNRA